MCETRAVRAVALLGPHADEHHVRPFELPGVNVFSGNELDPTDQPDAALILGGDGTIHRHLGPLALKKIPVLVVPMGSANDFAQSIGMESVAAAKTAWERFCADGRNVRAVDLGTIQRLPVTGGEDAATTDDVRNAAAAALPWRGESLETMHFVPDGPRRDLPQMSPRIMQSQLRRRSEAEYDAARTTYFSCIAGTGLDAAVNRRTLKQSHWLRGHGGYVVALLQTIGSFRPPRFTVSIQEGERWRTVLHEHGFLIAAGNGPQYGHGMRLTHRARMDDGLLDLCFVRELSKLRLVRLFRVVYSGSHIGMNEVEYMQATRIRIATEPVMEVFADGEYICETPVEIGVAREALRVIVPV
jgi:diacylglycerol kinase family enzyme